MDTMMIIPGKPSTLNGIGIHLFGRSAMYILTFMNMFNQIGLNMCYLIVLGNTLSSWTVDIFHVSKASIFAQKVFYIGLITSI